MIPLNLLNLLNPLNRLSPFELLEPLEPLEPIAGSKTKTKINPLKRMEGDALLPTTFIMKVTILIKAINRNKPFCLTCGSPLKPIL